MERIGNRIQKLMKEKGYKQKELASMVGVTETAMSRYLKNEREPKMEVVANLATALDTTTDYLIKGVEPDGSFEDVYRLVARSASTMTDKEKMQLMEKLLGK